MNKDRCLTVNEKQAQEIDWDLWNFSTREQSRASGWETYIESMTEEEKDGWLAWDEEWLAGGWEAYKALMALEEL